MGRPKATPAAFEIWQSGRRIASIDNPVRLRILRLLEHGPKTLNELVVATRKAKPTLSSLHIPPLVQHGLVAEAPDPHDGRVKWYRLVGHRLGSSAVEPAELRDAVLGYVESRGFLPLGPLLEVLQPARLVRESPTLADEIAERFGTLLGRMLLTKDRARATAELAQILERAGLGRVQWTGTALDVSPSDPELRGFLTRASEAALGIRERRVLA